MNSNFNLGQYVRDVFDLNKDGKVTFKEFFATLIPNHAVAIAFIVVDLLMAVAEYRVWDVGMAITNDRYKALGLCSSVHCPSTWHKFCGCIHLPTAGSRRLWSQWLSLSW